MEAFSYDKQYRPYILDSSFMFLPNTNTHVSSSAANINNHDHNHITDNNSHNSCFSPDHDQHHPFYNQPDRTVDVLSSVNTSSGSTTSTTKLSICSNNSSSSALTELINPMEKRKNIFQQPQSKVKGKKQKKETVSIDCMNMKSEKKVMSCKRKKRSDDKKKNYEESDQRNDEAAARSGYIYVRARRGQATDSHSLAERVRREKISQRMNLLQALVPGCHKVMGKANMLDEIISYVQSLQNQVEFLSLKIACVNPTLYDNGMNMLDSLIFKPEVPNQNQLQINISRLEATEQPNVLQQQNHTHITNTNICNTSGYSHMDNSTLLQHQQAQISNFMSLPQWKTLVSSPHTHVSPGTDLEELM